MSLCLETLIESDYVLVPSSLEDIVLLHHLFVRRFIVHEGLVNRFQGHELSSESVDGQIDLAKGTFANHFADFVVVNLGFVLLLFDIGQDRIVNQLSRGKWTRNDFCLFLLLLGSFLFPYRLALLQDLLGWALDHLIDLVVLIVHRRFNRVVACVLVFGSDVASGSLFARVDDLVGTHLFQLGLGG